MRARSHHATEVPPKLSDLGINKSQSSRWQAVDAVFCEIEMGSRFEAMDKPHTGRPLENSGNVAEISKYQKELDSNGIEPTVAYRWRTMSLRLSKKVRYA